MSTWTLATPGDGITVGRNNVIGSSYSTPIIGIYNPINSNINCIINSCSIFTYTNLTEINNCWGVIHNVFGIAGTTRSQINIFSGSTAINSSTFALGGSVAQTFVDSQILNSRIALLFRFISGVSIYQNMDGYTGLIINEEDNVNITCTPGNAVGIYVTTLDDTPVVKASMTWEEISIDS